MHEGHPLDPTAPAYDYYEDEIELMDLLKVIWKWKYLILIGTLICAAGAALISFQMTKIYRVDMSISPGILRINDNGKNTYIDSLENIRTLIEAGTFDQTILNGLDMPKGVTRPESIDFVVKMPKGLNALEVSYETPDPDLGLQLLTELDSQMRERYQPIVRYHKKAFDMEQEQKVNALENLNNRISDTNAQIETEKEKIKNYKERQRHMDQEIDRISKNTDVLIAERNKFLSSKESEKSVLSALLYSNTIQQNISYLNSLRTALNYLKNNMYDSQLQIEKMQNAIKDLENNKKYIQEQINDIEFKKNSVQNIQILQSPKKSPYPVKPKIKLNTVLAAVVGLFLTVFLAFFIEYISKYRKREAEQE